MGVEGEKERAVRVIAARLRAQPGLFDMLEGSADLAASCQQRVVDAPGKQAWTLHYVSIGTRDRSGFRMNAGEVQREAGGWGNKAVVANNRLGRAFLTTMGFHSMYWGNKSRHVKWFQKLGHPTSDEQALEGHGDLQGSMQHFEHGYLWWSAQHGCNAVLR